VTVPNGGDRSYHAVIMPLTATPGANEGLVMEAPELYRGVPVRIYDEHLL
jgi:hypothetical protein